MTHPCVELYCYANQISIMLELTRAINSLLPEQQ